VEDVVDRLNPPSSLRRLEIELEALAGGWVAATYGSGERVRGSHHVMRGGALRTTVPVHGSRTLRIGTLRGILRDIEMSPGRFEELWRQGF